MLYLIGIGLNDKKDISIKGLEAVKKCDFVYLECYTSKFNCSIKDLEKFYCKKIILADRNMVEKKAEQTILKDSIDKNVAFLVIGDVFGATTHVDLMLRAKKNNIEFKIINNASILNAISILGLELYKFGKTTSIPFNNKNVETPFKIVKDNQKLGLHTLLLLDLKPKEDSYMSINTALNYLLNKGFDKNMLCVGCSAIGSESPEVKVGKASELINKKFSKYPQCLVVVGKLHFIEKEAINSLWR
jgi:diphthine synthase